MGLLAHKARGCRFANVPVTGSIEARSAPAKEFVPIVMPPLAALHARQRARQRRRPGGGALAGASVRYLTGNCLTDRTRLWQHGGEEAG